MESNDLIFILFAGITLGSAALVVFAKKIVYAAFALMLSLFGVAGLYVFLSADFLAAAQVIIYVGGILVLILFGVLLTVKITKVAVTTTKAQRVWGTLLASGMIVLLVLVFKNAMWAFHNNAKEAVTYSAQSVEIGNQIMTKYLLPFEIASVLLLAALIGAMFIVRSEEK